MPTREQLQQNIVAMEQQGASQQDIQSYLDSLKQTTTQTSPQPTNSVSHGGISLAATIGGAMSNFGKSIAPGLVDTLSTNMANVAYPGAMEAAGQPQTSLAQNVGAGLELASFATPATAGTPVARIGLSAAQGAMASGGDSMAAGQDLGTVNKKASTGLITGAALGALGEAVSAIGKKVYGFVMPVSKKEAGIMQAYQAKTSLADRLGALTGEGPVKPRTVADTAFNANVPGSVIDHKALIGTEAQIGVQATKASNHLWDNVIQPKLSSAKVEVDMPKFFDQLEQTILKDTPELSRQKSLIEAVNAMREDYANVGKVTLEDLQKFKEGWAQFVPDKAYQGKPIAGAFRDVQDTAADLARATIYEHLGPEVRQAYIDYGNLKAIKELGQTAMTGGKLKGGFGSFWSAIKDTALTPLATLGGYTVYSAGKGIQLVGAPGALTVSQLVSSIDPATNLQDGQQ